MEELISIIVPTYKCAPFIEELADRCRKSFDYNYELIFVNDHSPINDWAIIRDVCSRDANVKAINLSRNFGQHYAINAGLEHATGEWVVVMDGDLQDQPEEIANLYSKAKEGYDIVFARRENRQDGYVKKMTSKVFYGILAYLTNTKQNPEIANFGIYHRKVVDAIVSMNDQVRYLPTMVRWVGFRQSAIVVKHAERGEGKSGYNFKSLIALALNVILSFSDKPLRLTVKLGLFVSAISLLAVVYTIFQYFSGNIKVLGYSSIIISIWLFSGIIITILGIVGLYVGRIFDQVKDRPRYIIHEKINFQ